MKQSIFAQYLAVTAALWVFALFVFDGGSSTLRAEPVGLVLNLALLPLLAMRSRVARTLLVLEAGASVILLGYGGLIVNPQPFGLLVLPVVLQLLLLWRLGRAWEADEKIAVGALSG